MVSSELTRKGRRQRKKMQEEIKRSDTGHKRFCIANKTPDPPQHKHSSFLCLYNCPYLLTSKKKKKRSQKMKEEREKKGEEEGKQRGYTTNRVYRTIGPLLKISYICKR